MKKKTGGREKSLTSLEIRAGYPTGRNTLFWQSLFQTVDTLYPYTLWTPTIHIYQFLL